jgi:hypothetical protein
MIEINAWYRNVLDILGQQNSYVLDFNLLYTRLSVLMKGNWKHEVWKNWQYLIFFFLVSSHNVAILVTCLWVLLHSSKEIP